MEWKVEVGDEVAEDQIVGEAETDKAVVDIPAPTSGSVKDLKVSPGDKVKVGEVIMELNESESTESKNSSKNTSEAVKNMESSRKSEKSSSNDNVDAVMGGSPSASSYDEEKESSRADTENKTAGRSSEKVLALPKVRKLAEDKGINLASLNIDGRITEEDILNTTQKDNLEESDTSDNVNEDEIEEENQDMSEVKARPSVRKLAREHDIEISMLDGTGRNGEITRNDVLNAAGEDSESGDSEADESKTVKDQRKDIFENNVERVEMSGIRKATANKMAESRFTAPHVTHIEKADITELVELRESVKGDVDAHITYLPFVMKALVSGLKRHPDLNSELDEENNEIIRKKFYDFNIAVDTDQGLLVPKVEDVDDKNLIELAESISDKVGKAQNNELSRKDMDNGTFSITNLGVIGGEAFTPIINYPQAAILGIGKIQETAEVVDGEVVPRNTVKLSLSYDHRIVDGAEAAKFMNKVVENLENPRELILEL